MTLPIAEKNIFSSIPHITEKPKIKFENLKAATSVTDGFYIQKDCKKGDWTEVEEVSKKMECWVGGSCEWTAARENLCAFSLAL